MANIVEKCDEEVLLDVRRFGLLGWTGTSGSDASPGRGSPGYVSGIEGKGEAGKCILPRWVLCDSKRN